MGRVGREMLWLEEEVLQLQWRGWGARPKLVDIESVKA